MAFSVHNYLGDGAKTEFVVNFTLGYLSQSHVQCEVEGEVDGLGDPIPRTLTWVTNALVDIGVAPADGLEVLIRRITPKTALYHDYQDRAIMSEKNLDESNLQNIMIAHEILDGYSVTRAFDLEMNEFQIKGMADPTEAQDGATKAYVDLISAQDQVALCEAQVVLAQAEVVNAQTEVANAAAQVVLAIAQVTLAEAQVALAVIEKDSAELAKTHAETAQGLAEDAQAAAEAAVASLPNSIEIDIGDWNMDTTPAKGIIHGITEGKIRSVSVIVRSDSDAGTNDYNLCGIADQSGATIDPQGGILYSAGTITVIRLTGGEFDSVNFNETSGYNRGWITIEYID